MKDEYMGPSSKDDTDSKDKPCEKTLQHRSTKTEDKPCEKTLRPSTSSTVDDFTTVDGEVFSHSKALECKEQGNQQFKAGEYQYHFVKIILIEQVILLTIQNCQ